MKNNTLNGQSLIEAVIMIAIVIIIVTSLVTAANTALSLSVMNKNRAKALALAKEGLEVVRLVRDADWTSLPLVGTSYCLEEGDKDFIRPTPVGGCTKNIANNTFSRTVVTTVDPNPTKPCSDATTCRIVTVTVAWFEGSKELTVPLESYITNWRRL